MDSRGPVRPSLPGVHVFPSAAGDKWDRISITSNGDFSTYADSGSGSVGDPWIITGYSIECNDSGTGILVSGTTDYATFRDIFVNESGTGVGTDANVLINGATHLTFDNVTSESPGTSPFIVVLSDDITIQDSTLNGTGGSLDSLYISAGSDIDIIGCNISNGGRFNVYSQNVYGDVDGVLIQDSIINDPEGGTGNIKFDSGDNVVMTNITINSSSIGAYYDILITNSFGDNITLQNSTFENLYRGFKCEDGIDNITIQYNTWNNIDDECVYLYQTTNSLVQYNTFTNVKFAVSFYNQSGTIFNNTIDNDIAITTDYRAIELLAICDDVNVSNNYIDSFGHCITDYSVNSYIFNNTFRNSTYGINSLAGEIENNVYANNTFYNNTVDLYVDSASNNTFQYNNFSRSGSLLEINNHDNATFTRNWFANITAWNATAIENVTFDHNYYRDYFDLFPYAVTDLDKDVLEYEYEVISGFNDSTPCYWTPWFKVSNELAFHFYSNLDYLGLTFEWVKLYMDDQVKVRMDPIEDDLVFKVSVTDFAGTPLYEEMHNANLTLDLDIGLNITIVQIKNKFDKDVLFHLVINGLTIVYPIAAESEYPLRMSLGTCSYWVTDLHGNTLEDINGDDIVASEEIEGPDVISFGFIVVETEPIDDGETSTQANPWLAYLFPLPWFITLVIVIAIFAVYKASQDKQQQSQKTTLPARPRSSVSSRRGSTYR